MADASRSCGKSETANEDATSPELGGCCEVFNSGNGTDRKVSKRLWIKLGLALVIAGQGMMLSLGLNTLETPLSPTHANYWVLHGILIVSSLAVVVLLGKPLFVETWRSLTQLSITVEALFFLSFVGAFGGSLVATFTGVGDVYYEVVAIVMCVYTVGKSISGRSRERAMTEVEKLRETFDQVTVYSCCGELKKIGVRDVEAISRVIVAPGEPIAVDGIIVSGHGYVQETAMTGELMPVVRGEGEAVLAGTYSVDGRFEVKPERWHGDRRLDQVLHAVSAARMQPSRLQRQADRIVQWFVPLVTGVSVSTFLIWLWWGTWSEALFNSMAVLLVACPCALGLATPIAVWSGLHRLAKLGLVARSGHFLDALAQANHVVFDKTGTLSEEDLAVGQWVLSPTMEDRRAEVLGLVLAVEMEHSHPIARALCGFARREIGATSEQNPDHQLPELQTMTIVPGLGVRAQVKDAAGHAHAIALGRENIVEGVEWSVLTHAIDREAKRRVHIVLNNEPVGVFVLQEKLRVGTAEVFAALRALGLKGSILTGDPDPAWTSIETVPLQTGLSPQAKIERVRAWREAGDEIIYLGDGINDSGAMAECMGSIAMGQGAALTKSTAGGVLLGSTLESIPKAIEISRSIFNAIRENMLFAISYNITGMALAACGVLHPIVAALLMVGSSIIVSMRASRSAMV